MGTNGSRVIQIKNVEEHLAQCELLTTRRCPIYGSLQCVRYKGMDFNIAESHTEETPHPASIHYLVLPEYLIFPDFTLLQDLCPANLTDLLSIISGISEMALHNGPLGIAHGRIGYNMRWGVVGELPVDWNYQQVFNEGVIEGVYLSPQQMISLAQNRAVPRCDPLKADVFALGLMLVEIVFREELASIYDFQHFEVDLKPLLEKLSQIKGQYGEEVCALFVGMLQIEEEHRFDFQQILDAVADLLAPPPSRPTLNMLNSNGSQRTLQMSKGARTSNNPYCRTPKQNQQDKGQYRNDVSPFRGRFGGAVKNNSNPPADKPRRTPDRAQESRSPMRRQTQRLPNGARQDFGSMQRVSPLSRR